MSYTISENDACWIICIMHGTTLIQRMERTRRFHTVDDIYRIADAWLHYFQSTNTQKEVR